MSAIFCTTYQSFSSLTLNGLSNILEKDWVPEANGCIANIEELRIGQLDDLKIVLFLHVFDPPIALALWIDDQRPTLR